MSNKQSGPPKSGGAYQVSRMGKNVRKADTRALISTNAVDSYPPDPYAGIYAGQDPKSPQIIEPTFKPGVLKAVCSQNNILPQCVEAMEVNIDGTGFSIEQIDDKPENKAEQQMLQDFFDEPYPGKSMITVRRNARDDLEQTGNAYLEVGRSADDAVMTVNYLDACEMRIVRLDDPIVVQKPLTRSGKEIEVTMRVRERRFVQMVNGNKVYFKEFGATRDLDRSTGQWAEQGKRLPVKDRASEVIHLTVNKEAKTPYGAPRWINQLPSVLGSRKAEEFNLEFFDAGGLPPVLVVVQGGYLADGMKETLEAHLSGKGSNHRAAVVEAISSSGSLDSSGAVKVTVERFGTERQQDSMFQTYDKNCEEHVRVAFRLPPLFIGRAQDYNFATAQTGYMVAEAQVFAPERAEFDERMWYLCKALGAKSYFYQSKPMTIKDVATSLAALTLAANNKIAKGEDIIDELNALTGMNLEYEEPPEPPAPLQGANGAAGTPTPAGGSKASQTPEKDPSSPSVKKPDLKVVKAEDFSKLTHLIKLADDWTGALGLRGPSALTEAQTEVIKSEVNALQGDDQKFFNELIASRALVDASQHEGLAELCGHAALRMMEKL